ncbi:hypothetical protein [Rhodococcoides kyotonense]|uniref:hypothetical protein n=1 Tax=Rhodococcoides kyotonense TaxID=398843 RepID=UPI0011310DE6|nr:hypothetical protein [Rhodococcus kyotonensis]
MTKIVSTMCRVNRPGVVERSVFDLVYVLLWQTEILDPPPEAEWPEIANRNYAKAIREHAEVLQWMGGVIDTD